LNRRDRRHLGTGDRAAVTLLTEVLRERGKRFLHGPDTRGRYLASPEVDEKEVGTVLADLEKTWEEYRSTLRGPRTIRTWIRREATDEQGRDRRDRSGRGHGSPAGAGSGA
jgi:hypothetical protein